MNNIRGFSHSAPARTAPPFREARNAEVPPQVESGGNSFETVLTGVSQDPSDAKVTAKSSRQSPLWPMPGDEQSAKGNGAGPDVVSPEEMLDAAGAAATRGSNAAFPEAEIIARAALLPSGEPGPDTSLPPRKSSGNPLRCNFGFQPESGAATRSYRGILAWAADRRSYRGAALRTARPGRHQAAILSTACPRHGARRDRFANAESRTRICGCFCRPNQGCKARRFERRGARQACTILVEPSAGNIATPSRSGDDRRGARRCGTAERNRDARRRAQRRSQYAAWRRSDASRGPARSRNRCGGRHSKHSRPSHKTSFAVATGRSSLRRHSQQFCRGCRAVADQGDRRRRRIAPGSFPNLVDGVGWQAATLTRRAGCSAGSYSSARRRGCRASCRRPARSFRFASFQHGGFALGRYRASRSDGSSKFASAAR